MNDEENTAATQEKRVWWERPLIAIWVFLQVIFLQSSIASFQEREPRAAVLFAGMFFTLLISGLIIWAIRKNKLI